MENDQNTIIDAGDGWTIIWDEVSRYWRVRTPASKFKPEGVTVAMRETKDFSIKAVEGLKKQFCKKCQKFFYDVEELSGGICDTCKDLSKGLN